MVMTMQRLRPEESSAEYLARLRRLALEAEKRGEAVIMRDPGPGVRKPQPRKPSGER